MAAIEDLSMMAAPDLSMMATKDLSMETTRPDLSMVATPDLSMNAEQDSGMPSSGAGCGCAVGGREQSVPPQPFFAAVVLALLGGFQAHRRRVRLAHRHKRAQR